ncbi:MAG: PLDc N-terminal domain-containing protein [Gallionella sp.]
MISAILQSPQWLSVHVLFVMVGLLTYVLTTHSLQQRRAPAAAISWVLAIALIPYIGLPLYLLFGARKLVHSGKRINDATPLSDRYSGAAWLPQLAASMGQMPVASYKHLHIHTDGMHALHALWDLLDSAEHELVLSTFLIGRDSMGRELVARLIEKARSGVRIRLLIDGAGRMMGGGINLHKLKAAGV